MARLSDSRDREGMRPLGLLVLAAVAGGCLVPLERAPVDPGTPAPAEEAVAPLGLAAATSSEALPPLPGPHTPHAPEPPRVHLHDAWGGAPELPLAAIEGGIVPLPLLPCRAGSWPTGDCYPAGVAIADFTLPPGALVPDGTAEIDVRLTALTTGPDFVGEPAPSSARLFLQYLPARAPADDFRDAGELWLDAATVIPLEEGDADYPHAARSHWVFRVYTDTPSWTEFNLSLVARRGLALTPWPDGPEERPDVTTRLVLDSQVVYERSPSRETYLDGAEPGWVSPTVPIGPGLTTLAVSVRIGSETFRGPPPDVWRLQFHNASRGALLGNGGVASHEIVLGPYGARDHFALLRVDGTGVDDPYAARSRWGFRVVPGWGSGTCGVDVLDQLVARCEPYPHSLEYGIRVVANG